MGTWSCPACGSVASSQGGCRVQRQHHYRHCCSRAPVSLHSLFSIPQSSVMASEPPLGSTLEQLSRASVCGKRTVWLSSRTLRATELLLLLWRSQTLNGRSEMPRGTRLRGTRRTLSLTPNG